MSILDRAPRAALACLLLTSCAALADEPEDSESPLSDETARRCVGDDPTSRAEIERLAAEANVVVQGETKRLLRGAERRCWLMARSPRERSPLTVSSAGSGSLREPQLGSAQTRGLPRTGGWALCHP